MRSGMSEYYMNSLEINSNAEERVREQFSAALDSKDKTIQDLQGQVARLQGEKDSKRQIFLRIF